VVFARTDNISQKAVSRFIGQREEDGRATDKKVVYND
jgi:hypothetical protein